MMKKFTHVNEGFQCEVCGALNPPAPQTCRNHCSECLCSKHVDINPGDRAEKCGGIMRPIEVLIARDVMDSVIFQCEKCGIVRRNRIAPDDNREKLFEIIERKAHL